MERMADRRPPWFWWLLILILSSCFAILSWALCISIFHHPEVPRNYELLKSIDRLPELKTYTSQTAPGHPSGTAQALRQSYLEFTDSEISTVNTSLLQSYLTNFRTNTFCTYLKGHYKVIAARPLTSDDIITEGFAVQFRAYMQPDNYTKLSPYPVIAEIIFPTRYDDSYDGYQKGDLIEFGITPHFASLLHLEKVPMLDDDTIIVFTAVSLANKMRPPHKGPFDLRPPKELNLNATFPLFNISTPTTSDSLIESQK